MNKDMNLFYYGQLSGEAGVHFFILSADAIFRSSGNSSDKKKSA
jgi:hypothetical protein